MAWNLIHCAPLVSVECCRKQVCGVGGFWMGSDF